MIEEEKTFSKKRKVEFIAHTVFWGKENENSIGKKLQEMSKFEEERKSTPGKWMRDGMKCEAG